MKELCQWVQEKYPSIDLEVVLDEDNTVRGLYFQDQGTKTAFERFLEVILMDATHKTNTQDMPLYTVLCIVLYTLGVGKFFHMLKFDL